MNREAYEERVRKKREKLKLDREGRYKELVKLSKQKEELDNKLRDMWQITDLDLWEQFKDRFRKEAGDRAEIHKFSMSAANDITGELQFYFMLKGKGGMWDGLIDPLKDEVVLMSFIG